MGHTIPVFFFPLDKEDLPEKFDEWNDATDLISDKMNKGNSWESTIKGWWDQLLIEYLCEEFKISDLDFLNKEIVYLDQIKIKDGLNSIQKLIKIFNYDTLKNIGFDSIFEELKKEILNYKIDDIKPLIKNDDDKDTLEHIIIFIKSIQFVMEYCIKNNKLFVYVQPQP
jgi:hypothetical protein